MKMELFQHEDLEGGGEVGGSVSKESKEPKFFYPNLSPMVISPHHISPHLTTSHLTTSHLTFNIIHYATHPDHNTNSQCIFQDSLRG